MVQDSQIVALRRESATSGDTRQEMICVLALGGPSALDGAEDGTDAHDLLCEGMTQDEARRLCGVAIDSAAAQDDGE